MKRLVILAPNWLGDAVMALPAIADVRRASPAASITVAARAAVAPLFALVPEVDGTLILGRDASHVLGAHSFDTALLLPNSTRAALDVRRAAIPERWGYRTGWRGALLTRAIPPPRGVHQIEYYQRLVHALGFPNGPADPKVIVSTEARNTGRTLLAASGWDGQTPLVALAPGAAYGSAKRWPPKYFAALVEGLADDRVQCVMVGTAADAATARDVARAVSPSLTIRRTAEALAGTGQGRERDPAASAPKLSACPTERSRERGALLDLVGRTDLSILAGVLASCRALVTNDSGAMHLAAAIGIPVTAMFGPTDEEVTSPRSSNPESRITLLTHPVWCRPCMLRDCPLDHRCMRGIGVAAVLQAARNSL